MPEVAVSLIGFSCFATCFFSEACFKFHLVTSVHMLSVHMYVYTYIYIYICMSVYMYIHVYLYVVHIQE